MTMPEQGSTASGGHFRINSPGVLHETVEDETIIVNLDTGTYYDLNPSGAFLFGLLSAGATIPAASEALSARYGLDPPAAQAAVRELVNTLLAEEVLVSSATGPAGDPPAEVAPSGAPYAAPVLGKYTDMQELLLLDPVHEVDETGWPRRA